MFIVVTCYPVHSSSSTCYIYKYSEDARSRDDKTFTCIAKETAASVAVAATVFGAALIFLVQSTKIPEIEEEPTRVCEDCGGSGTCSECKGEGFVLKKLSDESAEKARLMAKNMATRYTTGLPKKWTYCTKCSSARLCSTCGGSGKLSYRN